jgi:hypothetical protein
MLVLYMFILDIKSYWKKFKIMTEDNIFTYNLANYVFSGNVNMWWEQTGKGDTIVRPALVLTRAIQ